MNIGAFVPHDLKAPLPGAASGPLAGLRLAVKDMYDIEGERTGGGSPDWLRTHAPAARDAEAVRRLRAAGATVIGKTVCDELFYSLTGANAHYGTPVNLRAPGRLPGGSSAGSAAAVAAGLCDLALGSDTGGSVRVPASFCGVFGIRTTHGRVDATGAMAMAPSFDCVGWFADRAESLRKAGPVLLGAGAVAHPVERILLAEDCLAQADEAVAAEMRAFIARTDLRSQPVTVAPEGFAGWRDAFRILQAYEVWQTFGAWVEQNKPALGPGIRERIAFAATVTREQAAAQAPMRAAQRADMERLLPPGTALLLPTAPCIAPRRDAAPEELDAFRARGMALTCIAGLAGLPQVSLPAGTVEGCPIGLSLLGWRGGDEALLDFAVALAR